MENKGKFVDELKKTPSFLMFSWILVLLTADFIFSHPIWIVGMLIFISGCVLLCGNIHGLAVSFLVGIPMSILIIIANMLTVRSNPLNSFFYGLMMSIRLLTVTGIFLLYSQVVIPDRLIKCFRGKKGHVVTAMALAIRLMPLLGKDLKRIIEVYRCRGVQFSSGSFKTRVRSVGLVIGVLLQSSLERSTLLAESMDARGYSGQGRTSFKTDLWEFTDFIIAGILGVTLLLLIIAKFIGIFEFYYYPFISKFGFENDQIWILTILAFVLLGTPIIREIFSGRKEIPQGEGY